jgi:hypothetical protein
MIIDPALKPFIIHHPERIPPELKRALVRLVRAQKERATPVAELVQRIKARGDREAARSRDRRALEARVFGRPYAGSSKPTVGGRCSPADARALAVAIAEARGLVEDDMYVIRDRRTAKGAGLARGELGHILIQEFGWTYVSVAELLGYSDHGTIHHFVQRYLGSIQP